MRKMTHIEGTLETRLLSIILVDEDQNYWPTLNRLIVKYPEIGSVRIAAFAGELFDMLGDTPPDVVIIDSSMPGMDGFAATKRLLAMHPTVKVVILSNHNTDEYRDKARACGAEVFIPKQDAAEGLETVLKDIAIKKLEHGQQ